MSSGEGEDEVDFCLKSCSKDELAGVWLGKYIYVVEEDIVKVSIMWSNISTVLCTRACVCVCVCVYECVCACMCVWWTCT